MLLTTSHARRHDHARAHSDGHGHDHTHAPAHAHVHAADSPHPAQAAPWSILRMTVAGRLAAALAVCAVLWGVVLLAMR
ncbi:MAG TPA: hypothetical protein VNK51_19030 [Bradyrhizobium sp.]|nr:hypothetical protein [Bradyrhizobium sp.]